jgi:hypothetical protein
MNEIQGLPLLLQADGIEARERRQAAQHRNP